MPGRNAPVERLLGLMERAVQTKLCDPANVITQFMHWRKRVYSTRYVDGQGFFACVRSRYSAPLPPVLHSILIASFHKAVLPAPVFRPPTHRPSPALPAAQLSDVSVSRRSDRACLRLFRGPSPYIQKAWLGNQRTASRRDLGSEGKRMRRTLPGTSVRPFEKSFR